VLASLTRDVGVRESLLAATAMTVASWRRARQQDPGAAVAPFRSVITGLREVPNDGVDYGPLRYVGRVPELAAEPQIQFSYLGRLDLAAPPIDGGRCAPSAISTLFRSMPNPNCSCDLPCISASSSPPPATARS
jgi:hypothetical protein